jgi:hypothetical protein
MILSAIATAPGIDEFVRHRASAPRALVGGCSTLAARSDTPGPGFSLGGFLSGPTSVYQLSPSRGIMTLEVAYIRQP